MLASSPLGNSVPTMNQNLMSGLGWSDRYGDWTPVGHPYQYLWWRAILASVVPVVVAAIVFVSSAQQ